MEKIKIASFENIVDEFLRLRRKMKTSGWEYNQSKWKHIQIDSTCGCYAGFILESNIDNLGDNPVQEIINPERTVAFCKESWRKNPCTLELVNLIPFTFKTEYCYEHLLYWLMSVTLEATLIVRLHETLDKQEYNAEDALRVRQKLNELEFFND